jgi:thiol-disulfide isomerase/thioredoxin
MNIKIKLASFLIILSGVTTLYSQEEYPTLEIGQKAPDFSLPGVDGKIYSLDDFKSDILVIIFTCNHCPTAQTYEERIIKLVDQYKGKGVDFVAISPNDPLSVRLDEMGYTDLGDDFEDMKIRAAYKGFNFPYLYDGETEETSKKYGPVTTPHVFIFDKERKLRYAGRIDDSEGGITPETKFDTKNAIDALLAGKTPDPQTTKTFGCSIKWSDKRESVKQYYEQIYSEKVSLNPIDLNGIKKLLKNDSENLRLINFWATWCGPCVTEFPDLVEINFIYRHRSFELITIAIDYPVDTIQTLKFLQKNHSSCQNYLFDQGKVYDMIEAVNPSWNGTIPYTLLIKPGGEVVYTQQESVNSLELKRQIVKVLGRHKDW